MTLELRTEKTTPTRLTVYVQGRLDAGTFGQFDGTVQPLLAQMRRGDTVVLDLAGLEYVSSAGLRSFARVRKAMRALAGHTLLLHPQPQVRKVFEIVKAVPVNEIFVDARELDSYLDRIQRRMIEGDDAAD